jgi:hypothetical protein
MLSKTISLLTDAGECVHTFQLPVAWPVEKIICELQKTFPRKKAQYNFAAFDIGDVATFPTADPNRVCSAAYTYAKRHDMRFKCALLSNGKVRVMRIK